MNETLYILLFLAVYLFASYFLMKMITKLFINRNQYQKIFIHSFLYALFYGIGLVASGGDPGFGFPAPNLIAIIMSWDFIVNGSFIDIYLLLFWWLLILLVMLVKYLIQKRLQYK